MKSFQWIPFDFEKFWKAFREQHKAEECLIVVRRANGKANIGYVQGRDNLAVETGINLSNGTWSIFCEFDDGPPKKFAILAPPEFKIVNPDPALPLDN